MICQILINSLIEYCVLVLYRFRVDVCFWSLVRVFCIRTFVHMIRRFTIISIVDARHRRDMRCWWRPLYVLREKSDGYFVSDGDVSCHVSLRSSCLPPNQISSNFGTVLSDDNIASHDLSDIFRLRDLCWSQSICGHLVQILIHTALRFFRGSILNRFFMYHYQDCFISHKW